MSSRGSLIRLLPATFAIQAGFHGFTAALPVALISAGYGEGQIGVIVGTAFVVQMVAAPVVGALLDRVGPQRMLFAGIVAYLAATALMAVLPLDPAQVLGWMGARSFQGLGNAIVIPAVLTLVPLLVGAGGRGMWLAVVLLAQNMTLAVFPAASLLILEQGSFQAVAISVAATIVLGALLSRRLPSPPRPPAASDADASPDAPRRHPFRVAYRAAWTSPLVITLLAVVYWGVIFAYLPPRAELAGTSSALFFIGYGVAVIVSRVATGWLADRYQPRLLVGIGLVLSSAGIVLLVLPPTPLTLVGAGMLGGVSAGFVLSPILLELSYRSGEADRGSAFALFSVIAGGSNAIGSIGAAPIIESLGFEAAMLAGLVGVGAAFVLTVLDRSLGRRDLD